MAIIVFRNGRKETSYDFAEIATTLNWSQVDHVELKMEGATWLSSSPGEFWRQVRELAGVVQYA